jgi:hypothetical protein
VVPLSWKTLPEGPILEVAEGLLGQITTLKDAGLTGRMVLREFLFCQFLLLMARPTLMWEYIGVAELFVVAEGNLLEESVFGVAWVVLGSASGELAVGEGPAPFSVYEPRPNDLPYLGEVSIPLAQGAGGQGHLWRFFFATGRHVPNVILGGVIGHPIGQEASLFEFP